MTAPTMTKEIDLRDYPHIDHNTEDGREELTSIAAFINWENRAVQHFVFVRDGVQVGEMHITSVFEQPN